MYIASGVKMRLWTFQEMFMAGTDTTTSTLEWAMAELLHNPETLKKVQTELRIAISPNKKLEEKDIENLPYLRAVIKETLRLHPPLPSFPIPPHVHGLLQHARLLYSKRNTNPS
jgi:hypothetical protein